MRRFRPPLASQTAMASASYVHVVHSYCGEGYVELTSQLKNDLDAGAGKVLKPGGLLMVYGPFKKDGECTTASNAEFDQTLRSRNPAWGYRRVLTTLLYCRNVLGLMILPLLATCLLPICLCSVTGSVMAPSIDGKSRPST